MTGIKNIKEISWKANLCLPFFINQRQRQQRKDLNPCTTRYHETDLQNCLTHGTEFLIFPKLKE